MYQRSSMFQRRLQGIAVATCLLAGTAHAHDPGIVSGFAIIFLVVIAVAIGYELLMLGLYVTSKRVFVRRIWYALALAPVLLAVSSLISKYVLAICLYLAGHPDKDTYAALYAVFASTRTSVFLSECSYSSSPRLDFFETMGLVFLPVVALTPVFCRWLKSRNAESTGAVGTRWSLILPTIAILILLLPRITEEIYKIREEIPYVEMVQIRSEFFLAIKMGQVDMVDQYLTKHPKFLSTADVSRTALRLAAENGQDKVEALLMRSGVRPNLIDSVELGREDWIHDIFAKDPKMTESIEFPRAEGSCIQKRDYSLLSLLASYAKPIADHYNDPITHFDGGGPVILALQEKDMRTLRLVAPHTNLHYHNTGDTALHIAAWKGDAEALTYLLSLKANPNIKMYRYRGTPLHVAAYYGKLDSMRILLASGADVDGVSEESEMTPLSHALWQRETEAALLLLDAGAKPNANALAAAKQIAGANGEIIVSRLEAVLEGAEYSK